MSTTDAPGPHPAVSPFTCLARTHAIGAMSDAMIAVALAGSIFFSIDPAAARWRVALYLVLTIAPFAVVTPLIGPLVDGIRGGRRGMLLFTIVGRAVLAYMMAQHIDGLLLFPEAFGFLVLQKGYSVAKSAVVPKLVQSDQELVEANSKLALLGAVSGMVGAGIVGLAMLGDPSWSALVAVAGFTITTVFAVQIPRITVTDTPVTPGERAELRKVGIVLAASAMGMMRATVGFMTFLLAFEFRGGTAGVSLDGPGRGAGAAAGLVRGQDILGSPGAPVWHFGAVLVCAGTGVLFGAWLAPRLRRTTIEERIISGALVLAMLGGVLGTWLGSVRGAMVRALVVAGSSAAGKLAFDSLVQRDAPDANHGRWFARFEGRFQLSWAVGALAAVALPLSVEWGYGLIAAVTGLALVSYLAGSRRSRRVDTPVETDRSDGQLGFWRRDADDLG